MNAIIQVVGVTVIVGGTCYIIYITIIKIASAARRLLDPVQPLNEAKTIGGLNGSKPAEVEYRPRKKSKDLMADYEKQILANMLPFSNTVDGYELSERGKLFDFRKRKPGAPGPAYCMLKPGGLLHSRTQFNEQGYDMLTCEPGRTTNGLPWTSLREFRRNFVRPTESHPKFWEWLAEESDAQERESQIIFACVEKTWPIESIRLLVSDGLLDYNIANDIYNNKAKFEIIGDKVKLVYLDGRKS